ncbi:4Fe-4S binding protein [Roseibium sp. Sym1]|uniref:4Fe-4S binding protein n=1 Tax=Roseibium sp. Sym1 TaxID=3016006 RepID=UPI0022B3E5D5|nr:4Fe-4S binding protein [Roseibium sp. Sym1]
MGGFQHTLRIFLIAATLLLAAASTRAQGLTEEELAAFVMPPFSVGDPVNDKGVRTLLNSGGAPAGFVLETGQLAPLPGFSGAPINMLVMLDLDGRFLDVQLISQNEPVFVSGLGEAPFRKFLEQYRGHSLQSPLVVGTPYGKGQSGGELVYLDGVTKATASVRIAHESILAAALAVAREKMRGMSAGPPAYPDPDHDEALDWRTLVETGLVTRLTVLNREVEAEFAGTLWEDDDPAAREAPDEVYLDLWLADLGPPAIARALLSQDSYDELQNFRSVFPDDEPILVVDTGRHGLVSESFVRNTAPDLLSAEQDGLPVALRDADLLVEFAADVPEALRDGTVMILRTDRRLGFDPTREWTLKVQAVRAHGAFQPELGTASLAAIHKTDGRFFLRSGGAAPAPAWLEAIRGRAPDLVALAVFLAGLMALLLVWPGRLAALKHFTPVRLAVLVFVLGFVGWWGQGQLSVVTVLGTLRTAIDGGSFAFLLYDPFSLLIWCATVAGFVLWGRGFFCGWLCPFGALQEFAHHAGRILRLPQLEPSRKWDARLKKLKYAVLALLIATVLVSPGKLDTAAEVEPFKTAITVVFAREWPFVAYAAFWILLGAFTFKGFCRYVCPLGAVMAIGGLVRGRDWIARRNACGDPCQLCRVRCKYGAISPAGAVDYSECFQCMDCVKIHDDPGQCVPLVLAARNGAGKVAGR